jgi:hypothetical protein
MTNAIDMHSELIDAGWHVDIKGNWRSPNPNDARFTFNLHAAWRAHLDHLDQPPPPHAA